MKLNGKVIAFKKIKYVPGRSSFLDVELAKEVDRQVAAGAEIEFMPNDIEELHMQDEKFAPAKYKIALHGVLRSGRKATILIDDITPYFHVKLGDNPEQEAVEMYGMLCDDKAARPTAYEVVQAKPFMLFQEHKSNFVKFTFDSTKRRRAALNLIKEEHETFSNDLSNYYRMWSRDREVPLASWLTIRNFSSDTSTPFKELTLRVHERNVSRCTKDIIGDPTLGKDRTMTMTWDIETISPDNEIPQPQNPTHHTFMLACTFQWHWSKTSMLNVCFVDKQCAPVDDALIVICRNEAEIFEGMGIMHAKMRPEIVMGFNDSRYDWVWLIERSRVYGGSLTKIANNMSLSKPWRPFTDDSVYKYNCRPDKIKVEADSYVDGVSLRVSGTHNLDIQSLFRQLYPTAEKSSLSWFLAQCNLGSKEDMPYEEMFDICRTALLKEPTEKSLTDMSRVAKYCIVDAFRCHELMRVRNILGDRREVASLSYTSLGDAFFRANGSKVCNLLFSEGKGRGLLFNNITNGMGAPQKYPGAYVFEPDTGLVAPKLTIEERLARATEEKSPYAKWLSVSAAVIDLTRDVIKNHGAIIKPEMIPSIEAEINQSFPGCVREFLIENIGRPITGLDFSSLYPSIIMCYNLSPEYIIKSYDFALEMSKKYNLHRIEFDYGSSTVIGWSVRHDNLLDPDDPNCRFGLVPSVLKKLFDTRKSYKEVLHKWESRKEQLEKMPAEELAAHEEKYDDVCFNFNYWDSKQKALKVFMNTFYGQMGNKLSPIFLLEIAGGITSAGQRNIKAAQAFVEKMRCSVLYGDTDSLYISTPEVNFAEADKLYYTGQMTKQDYMTSLVDTTFESIKPVNKAVNEWFVQDNGTNFLRMAYEEVLYPVAFLAKKKYYGIAHKSMVNFDAKELFIRGLEVKKRGVSDFLRKACMDIMWRSVAVDNTMSLLELVYVKIDEVYTVEWDFRDFVKTAVYKPKKQNVSVQTFIARMKERGIAVTPHERFEYVIIRKYPSSFNHRGCKQELSVGDRMEFVDVARSQNMPIDKDYYVKGGLIGQLARLIVYHPHVKQIPEDSSEEASTAAAKRTFNSAKRYITDYCKGNYANFADKGKIYKRIFADTNKVAKRVLSKYVDSGVAELMTSNYDLSDICNWLASAAEKASIKEFNSYGKKYIAPKLAKLKTEAHRTELTRLCNKYFSGDNPVFRRREREFDTTLVTIRNDIGSLMADMKLIFSSHTAMIEHMTQVIKEKTGIDDMFNAPGDVVPDLDEIPGFASALEDKEVESTAEADIQQMLKSERFAKATADLADINRRLRDAYDRVVRARSVVTYLKWIRDKKNGILPRVNGKKQMVAEMMATTDVSQVAL
jgi:DNA polymerase elongation subunit (family B)